MTTSPRYRLRRVIKCAVTVIACSAGASCGGDKISGPVPVASVGVVIASPSVVAGTTTQATATTRDSDGAILAGRSIVWSSSDDQVASVTSAGVVTAHRAGTAQIRATSEGKEGSATLTVTPPPVATVDVTLASPTISAGSTTSATAALKDANGNVLTGRAVAWSSSDVAIATVNDQGVVTAVKAGNASIIATSEGKTGSAPLTVTPAPIHTITVVIADPSMQAGSTRQASAVAKDANGNVLTGRPIVWTTDNAEVATVNEQGVVTGVKPGSATITATSEGKSGSATVSVAQAAIHSITVVIAEPSMEVGSTRQASAVARDVNGNVLTGRPIVWSTDNAEVARINEQGLVTGVTAGSATITATSEGKSGSATVTVRAAAVDVRQRSLGLGTYHACAIAVDGFTYCWGAGYNGQLGSFAPNSWAPRRITGDHKFSAVSAAQNTTYAVNANGELYCWGGEPCDPTAGNPIDPFNGPAVTSPKRMETSRTIEVIGTGSPVGGNYVPMCAIGLEYVAYCWGKNESGQLGLGSSSSETVLAPDRPVVGDHGFIDVAEGLNHVCALNYGGRPYCWGSGSYGALGDGSGANSAEPRAVWSNQAFEMIGAGSFFACGLTNVTVYCWGANDVGQLGTTTGTCLGASIPCSATPVAVSSSHLFDFLAVGGDRACGVASSGDIYCWGRGFGPTPTRFRSVLAAESGGVRFATVDLGASHICAISTTGDAWCRGSNHLGQLGNGSYTPSEEPTMVIGGVKFRTP